MILIYIYLLSQYCLLNHKILKRILNFSYSKMSNHNERSSSRKVNNTNNRTYNIQHPPIFANPPLTEKTDEDLEDTASDQSSEFEPPIPPRVKEKRTSESSRHRSNISTIKSKHKSTENQTSTSKSKPTDSDHKRLSSLSDRLNALDNHTTRKRSSHQKSDNYQEFSSSSIATSKVF